MFHSKADPDDRVCFLFAPEENLWYDATQQNRVGVDVVKTSKVYSVLCAVLLALAVVSGSVAVPILCRSFYYAQIGPLNLEEMTGLQPEVIREAYDGVMDYCTGKTESFSAGLLPFSESGASHFEDVRGLFLLDLRVLVISLVALAALFLYARWKKLVPQRFLGRGPGFWGAAGLGGAFLLIGGLAALDFDRAFVIFHTLFFPGKDNWIFDWRTDPVILILPQEFFRNCAVLILVLLLLWCGILIAADFIIARKKPMN